MFSGRFTNWSIWNQLMIVCLWWWWCWWQVFSWTVPSYLSWGSSAHILWGYVFLQVWRYLLPGNFSFLPSLSIYRFLHCTRHQPISSHIPNIDLFSSYFSEHLLVSQTSLPAHPCHLFVNPYFTSFYPSFLTV